MRSGQQTNKINSPFDIQQPHNANAPNQVLKTHKNTPDFSVYTPTNVRRVNDRYSPINKSHYLL